MPLRVLIVPDKFKGSLTARQAARAIAAGWRRARPQDRLELLPMSDGGEGFGDVLRQPLQAHPTRCQTLNAAHRPIAARYGWSEETKTAVIESAQVIGLLRLPLGKFHPFQLDTFGLARLLRAAAARGARRCLVGIGGSATNDGGFGLARGLGWVFVNKNGETLGEWWQLAALAEIRPPAAPWRMPVTVAADVGNPLLGVHGCSRVYGPQKGLRAADIPHAEKCLRRLAEVHRRQFGVDFSRVTGAGAAGGLGFGLMAFAGATIEKGFEIFAAAARLEQHFRAADLILTGEGRMDRQTFMGKGVGQLALWGRRWKKPCIALVGAPVASPLHARRFTLIQSLAESQAASAPPAIALTQLAQAVARSWRAK